MPRNWKTLAGIVVALILGGCVTDERSASGPAAADAKAEQAKVEAPVVAEKDLPIAPDATFTDLSGQKVTLAKLKGKVVYIDFWATWCGPCKLGLPFTDRLNTTFKDKGLVVLAVSAESAKTVKDFLAGSDYKFAAMLDPKKEGEKFNVSAIPHTIIIDREGRMVSQDEGLVPQAETIKNLTRAGLDTSGFEPLHDPTLDNLLG